jgi:hypothetical protein
MRAGTTLAALGVRLVDGGGQPQLLDAADQLMKVGIEAAVFADEERQHSGRRERLREIGAIVGSLPGGHCTELAVVAALTEEGLQRFIDHPATEAASNPRVARLQQVSDQLGRQSRQTVPELIEEYGDSAVRQAIGTCAHRRSWFKTDEGGRSLGKLIENERLDELLAAISSFWAAIAAYLEIPQVGGGENAEPGAD